MGTEHSVAVHVFRRTGDGTTASSSAGETAQIAESLQTVIFYLKQVS